MNRLFLMAATVIVLLTSCSKSDDDKDLEISSHLIGVWYSDGDVYGEIKSLGGTIRDGIIYGCTANFEEYDMNPAVIEFKEEQKIVLTRIGLDIEPIHGEYRSSFQSDSQYGQMFINYDTDERTVVSYYRFHNYVFEKDYNTVYFYHTPFESVVSRYRRK